MQKMLACDIDGTLILNHDQKIEQRDLEAIKKFRNKGHFFTLCTGRTLVWTMPLLKKYNIQTDGLILCNGSLICQPNPKDSLDYTPIYTNATPNKIGLEIIKYFYDLGEYTIYWDDGINTYEIKDRLLSIISSIIQENYSIHISIEEALTLTKDFTTIGITPMSGDPTKAEEIKVDIITRWGEHITAFRNQFFIDISPKNASKGEGIKFLQSTLPKIECFGIGDAYNDLPMFQAVGKNNAFLMANGEQSLAPYTSCTVKNIAECIDILLS